MSLLSSRRELNAICDPSGDHEGNPSGAAFLVNRAWLPPSEFMMKMSPDPSRADMNAICSPSGDHAGWLFVGVVLIDRSSNPEPNLFTSRILARLS
jgi:hypothetical protein